MKQINNLKEKPKILNQTINNDESLIQFFKRYLKILSRFRKRKGPLEKIIKIRSKYEEKIFSLLSNRQQVDSQSPILNLILRYNLNPLEFKVFMFLLINYSEEKDEYYIEEEEYDEEESYLPSTKKMKISNLQKALNLNQEELRDVIFNNNSKLRASRIISSYTDKNTICLSLENMKVGLTPSFLKYLQFINEPEQQKQIKVLKHQYQNMPLENVLESYFCSEMSDKIRKTIDLIKEKHNNNQKFPVLCFFKIGNAELNKLIRAISTELKMDIIEFDKMEDVDDDDEIFSFTMDDNLIQKKFSDIILYVNNIVHIHIRKSLELKHINRIISENSNARKNLIIISSPVLINYKILGLDLIKNDIETFEFSHPDENIRKKIWISTIPIKYYNGSGHEEFTSESNGFYLEHIELAVQSAIKRMEDEGRNTLNDTDLIESIREIKKFVTTNIDEEDDDLLDINFAIDTRRCKENLKDVILPSETLSEIRRILKLAADKEVFYRDIYGNHPAYGKGIKIMFYGAPGTGKTLTAYAIAGELDLPIIELNLSKLINPLIGVTEKNISRYFKTAKAKNAILFIDECESLIMSRDKMERGWEFSQIDTFLKQVEQFDGILILSTNYAEIRDRAINRRISFFIEFKSPDFEMRKRLINLLIPGKFLTNIDIDRVCQNEFNGGDIRNAWLRLGLRIFSGEELTTEGLIEEINRERQKSQQESNIKRCGF